MNQLAQTWQLLTDPATWLGPAGMFALIGQHLAYTAIALAVSTLIAIPLGIFIGHTGKGQNLAVVISGASRALPSLGLLTFLAVTFGFGLRLALIPAIITLAVLAIPTLLAATYSGIAAVDDDVVDGARATGLSEAQLIGRVELPLAAVIIVGGFRSATLQVLSTATICAYLGLGGLGRPILDGLALSDYPRMLSGAIVVSLLALICDALLIGLGRLLTPTGVGVTQGRAN